MVKADFLRRQLTKLRTKYFDAFREEEEKTRKAVAGNRKEDESARASPRKMKPAVMAVERWLMHNALRYPHSSPENASRDIVFPMFHNMESYDSAQDDAGLEELVADLCVAKDREEDAKIIAVALLKISHSLALDIRQETATARNQQQQQGKGKGKGNQQRGGTAAVTMITHKHTLDVIYSSNEREGASGGGAGKKRQLLKLNPVHLAKLRTQYEATKGAAIAADDPKEEQAFLDAVFCLLARYQTIQGHGFQAAVAEAAFGVLHEDLGVDLEVFASPLNSTYARHCSAFRDTDACFGSLGSFFDLHPQEGSFEANPPFVLGVMDAMVTHITSLFTASTGPLSFVVVVPKWDQAAFYTSLSSSPWLQRKMVIVKEEHGFCDGASFQRQDRFRDSPYDTVVFLLQNQAGAKKWPASTEIEGRIRRGFAAGIPTEGMRLRQAKEGKGTADECRGVYKGPNKNKTGEGVMKRKREELKAKRKDKKREYKKIKAVKKA
jgi:hypothetical protein